MNHQTLHKNFLGKSLSEKKPFTPLVDEKLSKDEQECIILTRSYANEQMNYASDSKQRRGLENTKDIQQ